VVASTKVTPDGWKRLVRELASEVHGYLSRPSNVGGANRGEELLGREAEMPTCRRLDLGDRAGVSVLILSATWIEAVEDLVCEVGGERTARQGAEGHNTDQRTLEGTDVVLDAFGDHAQRVVVCEVDVVLVGSLAQDRQASGKGGGFDVGYEPSLETLTQPVLEGLQIVGRPIGGEDDLPTPVVEGVERME